MKQKLEEAEVNEKLKQAKVKRALVEATSISHSELADVINELPNIDNEPKVRHSSSYFVPRNITKSNIDPEEKIKTFASDTSKCKINQLLHAQTTPYSSS